MALEVARKLLVAHRRAERDAAALLAAAQAEAKASGRRLWVVSGGPRCGPCFKLARWMNDQHELLEKDYVLVKVMQVLDKNSDAADRLLPGGPTSRHPLPRHRRARRHRAHHQHRPVREHRHARRS